MTFLKNTWYVAAFGDEIAVGKTLARTLLGESITLYRTDEGRVAALQSACPHRFAPLHLGQVHGSDLACPYHGLRFNGEGRCVHNPHGKGTIPSAARVRSYPVEEREGLVWIWTGDAERCDRTHVPSYPRVFELPPQSRICAHIHSKANVELMTDNILDLSHADFLHPGSLSTGGDVTGMVPAIEDRGDEVDVSWRWTAASAPPVFLSMMPPNQPCEMTLQVIWRPAAKMYIRFAVEVPNGMPPLDLRSCHLMTPETEGSTHYFFVGSRSFMFDDPQFNMAAREQILNAFTREDKPIIEAVQRTMGGSDLWSLNPVLLSSDAGPVRVRRKLQRLIAAEQASMQVA